MPFDRRYRTRREDDRNFLSEYHRVRAQDAWETGLVAGAFLLSALAILIFA